ncbi:MAG: hypothetical protein Q4B70_08075 [Lachnospiraceae bacterium]|nr:hypothetical protein [Lachnospiraceae bacterium]
MMFKNDSAYMLVMEGCTKGKGEDIKWQSQFSKDLSKEVSGDAHEQAMKELITYLKDAVSLGMYYDVMRFLIKAMIYEDESFDYEGLYAAVEKEPELKELLPYAKEYADEMRKKNEKNAGDMADFLLKTQNIFSDDFGRFLYANIKKCSLSKEMALTEAEVDSIAKSVNKKARPGMLLSLIDYVYAGRTKNMEIFWYAMRKYILPVLGTAKFTEEKTNEQAILRNQMNQYAYYIYNVVYLSYLAAKKEQEEDDELDPLVEYWDKDENKKAIDDDVRRFYEGHKKVLQEVLSGRTFEGMTQMIEEL